MNKDLAPTANLLLIYFGPWQFLRERKDPNSIHLQEN
jgi:hypothetical protein